MFLYLSKLLPLFIYPLGLSSMLLVVGLTTVWKRPRIAAICMALALGTLLISSNAFVANYLVRSLESQHIPVGELPTADAIVVLGGATRTPSPPRPSVDLSEAGDRVIYAAQLYRQKKAPIIVLSGGRVEWSGSGNAEAEDMATILTSIGIPRSALILEPNSLNTYENAKFVKPILERENLKKVLLITSATHMPRSLLIFQRQGMDVIPAPTDFLVSDSELTEITATPKAAILGLLPDAKYIHMFTNAMKEYIGMVIYRLRGWI